MKLELFDYYLPENLIAQEPVKQRDKCKLCILQKNNPIPVHTIFDNISGYFNSDDVLVLNNSKVIPARILFENEKNAGLEIFCLKKLNEGIFECMVKPGKKFRISQAYTINENLNCKVLDFSETGRIIEFISNSKPATDTIIFSAGQIPLPPYIKNYHGDISFYQTIYSKKSGSAAAPTAGLHFTDELLETIKNKIADIIEITLHIGPGTFQPVKSEIIEEHKMHSEYYEINKSDYDKLSAYKKQGKRIIAVGTTSVRVLETVFGMEKPQLSGSTDIFIYPGYEFKITNALITNFHLPKSSLLMLVSALAGREKIMNAYQECIASDYRFFSFGDAMFIF